MSVISRSYAEPGCFLFLRASLHLTTCTTEGGRELQNPGSSEHLLQTISIDQAVMIAEPEKHIDLFRMDLVCTSSSYSALHCNCRSQGERGRRKALLPMLSRGHQGTRHCNLSLTRLLLCDPIPGKVKTGIYSPQIGNQ